MKRMTMRIPTVLLALSLLLSLLLPCAAAAEPEDAAENGMTISDEGVELIKQFEGYSATAYQDGGQWYIGYGTNCQEDAYPDGITEEEAEQLLRAHISEFEGLLNTWLDARGIALTQAQYDALTSFTYNIGTSWMTTANCQMVALLTAAPETRTDIAAVNAFGVWCHSGGRIVPGLVDRRLTEACIFLYGDYTGAAADNFVYLALDADGGKVENDIVFYRQGTAYGTLPTAEKEDNTLIGWQTQDGALLSSSDIAMQTQTVTAQWRGGSSLPDAFSSAMGTALQQVSKTVQSAAAAK